MHMLVLELKPDVLGVQTWWEASPFSKAKNMLQKYSNLKSNAANLFLVQLPTFLCILELIEPIFR